MAITFPNVGIPRSAAQALLNVQQQFLPSTRARTALTRERLQAAQEALRERQQAFPLLQAQIAAGQQLLPQQTALQQAQLTAQQQLLPLQTRAQQQLLPLQAPAQEARTALAQAQAKRLLAQAARPGGGLQLKGPAGDIQAIEELKQAYPNRPDLVGKAEDQREAQVGRWKALATYYGRPEVARLQMVRDQQLAQGKVENAAELSASLTKSISDTSTRQQYEALNGITNEMNNVDFPSIAQYAGPIGKAKLLGDEAQASFLGRVNPSYQNYTIFKKQTLAMTDQLRKALGTSIRNEYVKTMLLPIINNLKETWGNNPQIAQAQWNWAKRWLSNYRDLYHKFALQGLPEDKIAKQIEQTAPELFNYNNVPPGLSSSVTLQKQKDQGIPLREQTIAPSVSPTRTIPNKNDWVLQAKGLPQNANVSNAQLSAFYDRKYGGQR